MNLKGGEAKILNECVSTIHMIVKTVTLLRGFRFIGHVCYVVSLQLYLEKGYALKLIVKGIAESAHNILTLGNIDKVSCRIE